MRNPSVKTSWGEVEQAADQKAQLPQRLIGSSGQKKSLGIIRVCAAPIRAGGSNRRPDSSSLESLLRIGFEAASPAWVPDAGTGRTRKDPGTGDQRRVPRSLPDRPHPEMRRASDTTATCRPLDRPRRSFHSAETWYCSNPSWNQRGWRSAETWRFPKRHRPPGQYRSDPEAHPNG